MDCKIVLASGSPRRRELVGYMGIPFEVDSADVDETAHGAPQNVVMELALRKARAVAQRHMNDLVLAADTVVYAGGEILGKPRNAADAEKMLLLLQNSWHEVYTGVCMINEGAHVELLTHDMSRVQFAPMSREAIEHYIASGEPMDKAGAYAVQGIGGMFVKRIEGSYSNVVGLPMALVRNMLIQLGMMK